MQSDLKKTAAHLCGGFFAYRNPTLSVGFDCAIMNAFEKDPTKINRVNARIGPKFCLYS